MKDFYRWLRERAKYCRRSAASYRGKRNPYWEYRMEGMAWAFEQAMKQYDKQQAGLVERQTH